MIQVIRLLLILCALDLILHYFCVCALFTQKEGMTNSVNKARARRIVLSGSFASMQLLAS